MRESWHGMSLDWNDLEGVRSAGDDVSGDVLIERRELPAVLDGKRDQVHVGQLIEREGENLTKESARRK